MPSPAEKPPKRMNLWLRGGLVIGTATAVVWVWPYVLRRMFE
ncbi:hypothetical protein [Variovorax sp. PAMC 28711]|nr:hypothetical protein [Variovorax sp. PAMC 28711]